MASYKLFPEADATIYSATPDINTGLDEILELQNVAGDQSYNEVSRILLRFPSSEVSNIFNNYVVGKNFNVYLKMYNTETSELPLEYGVNGYGISGSWSMGIGKYLYSPYLTDDVSWTNVRTDVDWYNPLTNLSQNTSASYKNDVGGGLWYTNLAASQSFGYTDSKDVKLVVSDIVESQFSGSIPNNGILVKFSSSIEFTTGSNLSIKFFSKDTHTVYPPHLEFVWDDSSYITGSLSVLNTPNILLSVGNNKGKYNQEEIVKFRFFCREQFPTRQFLTSSLYNVNKALPSSSYWALKDVKTDEYVIDFEDLNKISCDSKGSYINFYMNGLQNDRYYKLIVKTIIGSDTIIVDTNSHFKIVS
jgi:hypothetical protein